MIYKHKFARKGGFFTLCCMTQLNSLRSGVYYILLFNVQVEVIISYEQFKSKIKTDILFNRITITYQSYEWGWILLYFKGK